LSVELWLQQNAGPSPAEERPAHQAGQSLCMACGLCCEGTLFSQTNLGALDDVAALSALGVGFVSDVAEPALKQPCAAYKNCACTIYADRPRACRQFRCALLRRFKANKISRDDALDVIRKAIALRDNVKQQMRAVFSEDHCNFDQFTLRLRSRWKDAASAEAKTSVSALFQSFAVLWFYIRKHFRPEWQR
jgi:hypothetical protein